MKIADSNPPQDDLQDVISPINDKSNNHTVTDPASKEETVDNFSYLTYGLEALMSLAGQLEKITPFITYN